MSLSNSTSNNHDGSSKHGLKTEWVWVALILVLAATVALVIAEGCRAWQWAQASAAIDLLTLSWLAWVWWEKNNTPRHYSMTAHVYHRAMRKVLFCVVIGVNAVVINCIRVDRWQTGVVAQSVGYGILFAGAAFIAGVMFGYLFGLRPSVQQKTVDGQTSTPIMQTNLEEIADWLTKLILGAGLVSLTKLPIPIRDFAIFMAKGVEPSSTPFDPNPDVVKGNPAIVLAIMCFFSISGILYGYLWTRYEQAATSGEDTDSSALALVDGWLKAANPPDDKTRTDMANAIKGASLETKMRILLQAVQYRAPSATTLNERSLPVFHALVDADPGQFFHRNRGECALALIGKMKDVKNSDDDWDLAQNLLSDAIRIRDRSGEKGWPQYELARAVCSISLDPNFKAKQPSSAEAKQSILADIEKAEDLSQAETNLIDRGHVIANWKLQNPKTGES
jgi:hypothetical protein